MGGRLLIAICAMQLLCGVQGEGVEVWTPLVVVMACLPLIGVAGVLQASPGECNSMKIGPEKSRCCLDVMAQWREGQPRFIAAKVTFCTIVAEISQIMHERHLINFEESDLVVPCCALSILVVL